ncbi:MAG: DUF523 domain-containing protein [Bacilli bacterium]
MKPVILVSACLLGYATKYSGGDNLTSTLKKLEKKYTLLPFCPEVDGGLSTPRPASEIKENRVFNRQGEDLTKAYELGATLALELARKYQVKIAIMKEKSPACGVTLVYDGTFTNRLIPGRGIATKKLQEAGITVYHETNFHQLLEK